MQTKLHEADGDHTVMVETPEQVILASIANALWSIDGRLAKGIEVDTGLDGGSLEGVLKGIATSVQYMNTNR